MVLLRQLHLPNVWAINKQLVTCGIMKQCCQSHEATMTGCRVKQSCKNHTTFDNPDITRRSPTQSRIFLSSKSFHPFLFIWHVTSLCPTIAIGINSCYKFNDVPYIDRTRAVLPKSGLRSSLINNGYGWDEKDAEWQILFTGTVSSLSVKNAGSCSRDFEARWLAFLTQNVYTKN